MSGLPIPTTLPVTPRLLPPRQQPDPWPGWTGLHAAADHTTHRAANGTTTDREAQTND